MLNFKGTYTYTLDNKNRINIPAKFRRLKTSPAPESWVLTRGLEGCIALYPIDEWEKIERKLDKLEFTRKKHRQFKRMILRDVVEVVSDKQGRIPITKELLAYANIEKTVYIQGMVSYIELWCPEIYEKHDADADLSYEELAENIFFGNENAQED